MDQRLKANLTSSSVWLRFIYMILFSLVLYLAMFVVGFCVIIQFFVTLITGSRCQRVASFASSLSQYVFQLVSFLTFGTNEKPFPFSDWPTPEVSEIETVVPVEAAESSVVVGSAPQPPIDESSEAVESGTPSASSDLSDTSEQEQEKADAPTSEESNTDLSNNEHAAEVRESDVSGTSDEEQKRQ